MLRFFCQLFSPSVVVIQYTSAKRTSNAKKMDLKEIFCDIPVSAKRYCSILVITLCHIFDKTNNILISSDNSLFYQHLVSSHKA